MIKKFLFSAMMMMLISGCLSGLDETTRDQDSVDETQYAYVISSDFHLELGSPDSTAWKLMWNESESSDIEGVLVGNWGSINMIGRVDSERVLSFASDAKAYGPEGINFVYFIIPGGEISGHMTVTADAYVSESHFYNAQFTATVSP